VLGAFGYIENANLLYCAGWEPGPDVPTLSGYRNRYFLHQELGAFRWRELIDEDNTIYQGHGAISQFFFGGDGKKSWEWSGSYNRDGHAKLRIQDIASNWESSTHYTPLFFACTQQDPGGTGYQILCHEYQGVNGVFYDGSSRWISREELVGFENDSWGIYNSRIGCVTGHNNMFNMACKYLTVTAP
jgi:hypothetical protein